MNKALPLFFTCAFILLSAFSSRSQNLVVNPGFETYGTIPCGWMGSSAAFAAGAPGWTSPTTATPDIFSQLISPTCTNYQPHSTSTSCNGWESPHGGNLFGGFYTYVDASTWREYVQAQLSSPMVVGNTYVVSAYFSLGDNSQYATNNIGIDLRTSLTNLPISTEIGTTPLINYTAVFSDTANWVLISDTIVAAMPYQYLIIGNFYNTANTITNLFNPTATWARSYYYVDDVSVVNISSVPVSDFKSSDTSFCEESGKCIDFYDLSTGNPISWQWFFPGAVPDTSTDQSPTNICYYAPGSYDVRLIVSNTGGKDTLSVSSLIVFGSGAAKPVMTFSGDTIFCSHASSYQWYYNGSPIPGATDSFYVAVLDGNYNVYITDDIGCNRLGDGILFTMENETAEEKGIEVYPNPAENWIEISLSSAQVESTIELFNALGQEVLEQRLQAGKRTMIDISALSSGIYLAKIVAGESLIKKIIIINK